MLSRSWREKTRKAIRVSESLMPSTRSMWLVTNSAMDSLSLDANDGHQVVTAADRVDFGNALHGGQGFGDIIDLSPLYCNRVRLRLPC